MVIQKNGNQEAGEQSSHTPRKLEVITSLVSEDAPGLQESEYYNRSFSTKATEIKDCP